MCLTIVNDCDFIATFGTNFKEVSLTVFAIIFCHYIDVFVDNGHAEPSLWPWYCGCCFRSGSSKLEKYSRDMHSLLKVEPYQVASVISKTLDANLGP